METSNEGQLPIKNRRLISFRRRLNSLVNKSFQETISPDYFRFFLPSSFQSLLLSPATTSNSSSVLSWYFAGSDSLVTSMSGLSGTSYIFSCPTTTGTRISTFDLPCGTIASYFPSLITAPVPDDFASRGRPDLHRPSPPRRLSHRHQCPHCSRRKSERTQL